MKLPLLAFFALAALLSPAVQVSVDFARARGPVKPVNSVDRLQFAGKPHLLLFGFLGMVACLIVAPIASMFHGSGEADSCPLVGK